MMSLICLQHEEWLKSIQLGEYDAESQHPLVCVDRLVSDFVLPKHSYGLCPTLSLKGFNSCMHIVTFYDAYYQTHMATYSTI